MNNLAILIGRITKDLELRTTGSGKSVLDLPIAINNGKKENGENDTTFITLSTFGKTAEMISKYCNKGDLIGASCIIKNHNWEKDGVKHYGYSFIANNITFLNTKPKKEQTEQVEVPQNYKSKYDDENSDIVLQDSDLPF